MQPTYIVKYRYNSDATLRVSYIPANSDREAREKCKHMFGLDIIIFSCDKYI